MTDVWTIYISVEYTDKYLYLTVIEDYTFIQVSHLSEMYIHYSHSTSCEQKALLYGQFKVGFT